MVTVKTILVIEAKAYKQANLVTANLNLGACILYVSNASSNISEPSSANWLEYPASATQLSIGTRVIVLYNTTKQLIKVISDKKLFQMDIYSILGPKVGRGNLYDKRYESQATVFNTGVYLVHVFSKDSSLTIKKIYKN